ncbi:hypothetical protein F4781DRAFT_435921 [Annulohypoxylon bovei var. microspora]|nr:hypothetical protein F4781DRAFT_435921 [Annulohypoxylon bovei var. microspora]
MMKVHNLILLDVFAPPAPAGGGYADDCKNMTLVNVESQVGLRAYCASSSGGPQCSILPLDLCYGTNEAKVIPQNMGNFSKRCYPTHSELNGTILRSGCHRSSYRKGPLTWTELDTNELIFADGGMLKCFNNRATTPQDCGQRPVGSGNKSKHLHIALIVFVSVLGSALVSW